MHFFLITVMLFLTSLSQAQEELPPLLQTDKIKCQDVTYSGFYTQHAFIAKYGNLLMDKIDTSCAQTLLQNYVLNIDNAPENKPLILANIDRLVKRSYGEAADKVVEEVLACKIVNFNEPALNLIDKMKEIGKKMDCMELKAGDKKIIPESWFLLKPSDEYLMEKTSDKNYQISFNINFIPGTSTKVAPQALQARVNKCLKDANPYLKGPAGEQLNIKILSEKDLSIIPPQEQPKPISITVEKEGTRSHSGAYEDSADCSTIIHELLHLTGLVDEYDERLPDKTARFSCRTVPKHPSIMKDDNEFYDMAIPNTLTCKCTSPFCKEIMKAPSARRNLYLREDTYSKFGYEFRSAYCTIKEGPSGDIARMVKPGQPLVLTKDDGETFTFQNRNPVTNPKKFSSEIISCSCKGPNAEKCLQDKEAFIQRINKPIFKTECPEGESSQIKKDLGAVGLKPGEVKLTRNQFSFVTEPLVESLLHPSHFERIIGGACPEIGKSYIACGEPAYSGTQCNKPAYCSDDKNFLGISK